MRKGRMLLIVAAVALLSAAVVVPGGPQPDDLKKQVATLRKEMKAQAAVIAMHDKALKDALATSEITNAWLAALPMKVASLKRALDVTREKGFTSAGPNPAARKALLKAISDFGHTLSADIPEPGDEK